jgi:TolA-binding protein
LTKQQNYEDAFDLYRLIAEKFGNSEFGAEALFKQGEMLEALGRGQEAAGIFEQFAKAYPEHVLTEQAMLRIADKEFLQASFGDAIEKYTQILQTATEPAVREEMLYRMAITYHNMQKYKESADTFAQVLEAFPQGPHVAESHLRIGDYLVREGNDPVKAIESYSRAYETDPKGAYAGRALKGLALARYETKDYATAMDLFYRVVTEFPDAPLNEKTYLWTAQELHTAKKYDESARVLQALLTAMPNYASPNRVRFKIAECRELAGKTEEALQLYQAIVTEAPKSTEAVESWFRMGKLYETLNQPDKAFEMYQEAANTNTGDTAARARFRIGEIQESKGEFEAAARSYMRVAILFLHEELSPESLWRAGQCYEKANALEQARKVYNETVEEFPESGQAAKARERLAAMG